MNDIKEFVLRRLTMTLHGDGSVSVDDRNTAATYLVTLLLVLAVGVIYVIWMYVRDGHSIGWFWGTFLAACRLTVYAILSFVFLLPAWQNWEETKQQSKVVVGFDVSRSMEKQDDPVSEGIDPKTRPTRQEKVIAFLGEPGSPTEFFKRLEKTNPVTLYRFGSTVDDDYLVVNQDGLLFDRKTWEDNQHEKEARARTAGRPFARRAVRLSEAGPKNRAAAGPGRRGAGRL